MIGLLAGIIGTLAFIPYAVSILKKETTPNKATWIIWAVLGIIIAASYYSAGARETAFLPFGYAIGIVGVAILVLKYGEGGWTLLDKLCLAGAALGLILWALTSDPVLALFLTTIIDAIGSVPTIKKTWERPGSEDKVTWILFLIANAINLFAIKQWTLSVAMYPVYVVILSSTMCALLLVPRKSGRNAKAG